MEISNQFCSNEHRVVFLPKRSRTDLRVLVRESGRCAHPNMCGKHSIECTQRLHAKVVVFFEAQIDGARNARYVTLSCWGTRKKKNEAGQQSRIHIYQVYTQILTNKQTRTHGHTQTRTHEHARTHSNTHEHTQTCTHPHNQMISTHTRVIKAAEAF